MVNLIVFLYFVVKVILERLLVIWIFNCVWIVVLIGVIVFVSILIFVVNVIILKIVVNEFFIILVKVFCCMINLIIVISLSNIGGFFKIWFVIKFMIIFFF